MLDRVEGDVETHLQPELTRPHATAQDHPIGSHIATVATDSARAAIFHDHVVNTHPFNHRGPSILRSGCQRVDNPLRLDLAIVGKPDRAQYVIDPHQWPSFPCLVPSDDVGFYAKDLRHRCRSPKLRHAFFRSPHDEASHLVPPGFAAGL